jgi:hypothetical protein
VAESWRRNVSAPRLPKPGQDARYWKIDHEHTSIDVGPVPLTQSVMVCVTIPPGKKSRLDSRCTGLAIMLTAAEVEDLIEGLRRALAAAKHGEVS